MDSGLQDLADKIVRYTADVGAQYVDVRAEQQQEKSAFIENGEVEHVRTNADTGIGIRKKDRLAICIEKRNTDRRQECGAEQHEHHAQHPQHG